MAENTGGASPAQANAAMRQLLLGSSPLVHKKVGSFSGSAGGNTRIKLINVGLVTRLFARVTASITIGTATATVGPKGFAALMNRIKLIEFDGTDRINVSGHQLFQRNSLRATKMGMYGQANVYSDGPTALESPAVIVAPIDNPAIPTSVGTTNLVGFIEIPVCKDIDKGDLRGMIMAQTSVGEYALSIDWASSIYGNGDDSKVYNGAATTTVTINSITVDLWQEYFLPQQVGNVVPIPQLDTLMVYELNGGITSSDNLATGAEKLISVPNVRQVHGIYFDYLNNGVLGGSSGNSLSQFRLIVNGNNVLREYDHGMMVMEQRRKLGTDFTKGVYFFDFSMNPLQTNLYGSTQIGLTPGGTVTAGASVNYMYETLYLKGQALSGLSQSG